MSSSFQHSCGLRQIQPSTLSPNSISEQYFAPVAGARLGSGFRVVGLGVSGLGVSGLGVSGLGAVIGWHDLHWGGDEFMRRFLLGP